MNPNSTASSHYSDNGIWIWRIKLSQSLIDPQIAPGHAPANAWRDDRNLEIVMNRSKGLLVILMRFSANRRVREITFPLERVHEFLLSAVRVLLLPSVYKDFIHSPPPSLLSKGLKKNWEHTHDLISYQKKRKFLFIISNLKRIFGCSKLLTHCSNCKTDTWRVISSLICIWNRVSDVTWTGGVRR